MDCVLSGNIESSRSVYQTFLSPSLLTETELSSGEWEQTAVSDCSANPALEEGNQSH